MKRNFVIGFAAYTVYEALSIETIEHPRHLTGAGTRAAVQYRRCGVWCLSDPVQNRQLSSGHA